MNSTSSKNEAKERLYNIVLSAAKSTMAMKTRPRSLAPILCLSVHSLRKQTFDRQATKTCV